MKDAIDGLIVETRWRQPGLPGHETLPQQATNAWAFASSYGLLL